MSGYGVSALESSIEQTIADTWAELLAPPQVDVDSNFFALGGHSLLAIQCLSRLRDKLPVATLAVGVLRKSHSRSAGRTGQTKLRGSIARCHDTGSIAPERNATATTCAAGPLSHDSCPGSSLPVSA